MRVALYPYCDECCQELHKHQGELPGCPLCEVEELTHYHVRCENCDSETLAVLDTGVVLNVKAEAVSS